MADNHTTYYHSPVGVLEITGTKDYITGVNFREPKMEEDAGLEEIPLMLINCTEQLIQYFNGERRTFDLPLNQKGSSFQQETWNHLTTIPFGKTISYIQLALKSGDPKATRAVAGANGKNNVAIIVPCHRVIGANRELVGYAGGLWRKRWLLEHERKFAYGVQTLF